MKRLAALFSALCLTLAAVPANSGGTGGQAIPQALSFDGDFVGFVLLTVQAGWLHAPHAVEITITSVNGTEHDHGTETHALADLQTFGDMSQGLVDVIVEWSSDTNARVVTDDYTVCARVIFGDNHYGGETCVSDPNL